MTPNSALVFMCLFWAGARGFGEPGSCFTQTCQISSSPQQQSLTNSTAPRAAQPHEQHSPMSRHSTALLINIIQNRQLKQLLSERQGQGEWEMNPWHFRQLPLLLFLTPPSPGSALQDLSHPACQRPMTVARPLGCAAQAELGLWGLLGC